VKPKIAVVKAFGRPVEPEEVPYLEELGIQLRRLRLEAGLAQWALADLAVLGARQVRRIERGESRTRRSTLERIANALTDVDSELGPADQLLDQLVESAGPALAQESPHADRIARRRARRVRKKGRLRMTQWQPPRVAAPKPRRYRTDGLEPVVPRAPRRRL
jgi:transcriptional regulator with XRE-family HTH domain